ncbi:glucokinase [Bacillus tianshenii]|uniref:Glucokinase n=1 Tax=Sutcliffiella tianshenii TaxID=1463404 RepID=A0ABS2NUY0_9BACI|nr:ROK family protein [Bacillus tianshenii]MBM7618454.1 glucokinase [Bacillus tianshenii]
MRKFSIGVDIGGTKIAAGVVSTYGEVLLKKTVATPKFSRVAILDLLQKLIEDLTDWAAKEGITLDKIGIGTAGQVDSHQGIILSGTANIKDWGNIHLKEVLSAYTELPVQVDNDVNVLTLAEKMFGAAKGYREIVCLALGTGVGGGVITNGSLVRGTWGGAAELGHITLDMNGEMCNCGLKGCLETYASGTWIAKRMQMLLEKEEGKPMEPVSSREVFRLFHEGNDLAVQVISTMIKGLSYGIVNLIHTFNPEVIVLGGGVMSDNQWIIYLVEREIRSIGLQSLVSGVKLKISSLDADSGIVGAAML